MEPEFYHKNLFGGVVDESPNEPESEEDLVGNKTKSNFNIFLLTDALAARRKKDAWLLYQKAMSEGITPEEIFWKLQWQVKSLLLALRINKAEEADMKPFPYSKAKGHLKNWQKEELEKLMEDLVVDYHETRRGNEEMETLLEKIILRI